METTSPELQEIAADILKRNGVIRSDNVSELSPEELNQVINYSKKLKSFDGLDEVQIATSMAEDEWIDEKGRKSKYENITQREIMGQLAVNRMHNLYNRLQAAFETKMSK